MSEAPGADTLELERELRAKLPPPDASWLVRKRGYFYRGESSGYTGAKSQAGRYTEAEAKDIASIEPDCMSALRASEWPDDPMTLSPEVLRRLLDALASLRAEKEELRRERDEARSALWDAGKAIEDARGLGPLQAELDDCLREDRPALEKEYRQITARIDQTLARIATLTKDTAHD